MTGSDDSKTQEEIFNKDMDSWWNPKGDHYTLHWITPVRFNYFKSAVENSGRSLDEQKVLDVGCGGGLLSEEFAKAGAIVTGIDLAPKAIEAAAKHAEKSNLKINYEVNSIEKFLIGNGEKFDIIVCSEVLEHVFNLEEFLRDMLGTLKPGGTFLFSTINKTLKAKFFAIYVAENLLGMLHKGTHKFDKFIRPSTLTDLLTKNDSTTEEIKGISFNPLKMDFTISNDLSVNYIGRATKKATAAK